MWYAGWHQLKVDVSTAPVSDDPQRGALKENPPSSQTLSNIFSNMSGMKDGQKYEFTLIHG